MVLYSKSILLLFSTFFVQINCFEITQTSPFLNNTLPGVNQIHRSFSGKKQSLQHPRLNELLCDGFCSVIVPVISSVTQTFCIGAIAVQLVKPVASVLIPGGFLLNLVPPPQLVCPKALIAYGIAQLGLRTELCAFLCTTTTKALKNYAKRKEEECEAFCEACEEADLEEEDECMGENKSCKDCRESDKCSEGKDMKEECDEMKCESDCQACKAEEDPAKYCESEIKQCRDCRGSDACSEGEDMMEDCNEKEKK